MDWGPSVSLDHWIYSLLRVDLGQSTSISSSPGFSLPGDEDMTFLSTAFSGWVNRYSLFLSKDTFIWFRPALIETGLFIISSIMSEDITVFLAVLPLLLMIVMILKLKMPIYQATLVTLILVAAICAFWLHTPVSTIGASIVFGALKGLWPITLVIFMAIYSYNLMVANARMDVLRNYLSGLSNDRRIVSLIIIWCFGTFLEGAAGFGTSVAIPISIMMALGFNPMRAAVAALVADTLSTTFGAVGIPISILASTVGLSETAISSTLMLQLGVFDLLLPFAVIYILEGSVTAFYGIAIAAAACGTATLGAQWLVAHYAGPQLVDFAGALAGLITLIVVSRLTSRGVPFLYRIREETEEIHEGQKPGTWVVLEAGAIYILSFEIGRAHV